jgi:hypothetical protein
MQAGDQLQAFQVTTLVRHGVVVAGRPLCCGQPQPVPEFAGTRHQLRVDVQPAGRYCARPPLLGSLTSGRWRVHLTLP